MGCARMRSISALALGLALLGGSSGILKAAEPLQEDAPLTRPAGRVGRQDDRSHAEGFKITLSASEPEVRQPIAMTLDHRGRVWIAENFSYPGWLQPAKEKDRILILEDTDGDGHFDRRTVFWDQGTTVTGLVVGFGGVWVAATPNLLFIPDANGDDIPDGPPKIVLDGWDVKAQHNLFNALNWGPDGWLYGCNGILSNSKVGAPGTPDDQRVPINCGVWRYHPTKKIFEAFAHGTTNPWGLDFNEDGELFITNCVIPHLFHAVPGARFQRMFGEDFNRHSYELIPTCADHIHWSRSEAWSDIRSLGVSSTTDRAGGGHAHTGAMFYLGDNWPDTYRDSVFMNNIHGHRVNRDRVEPSGSGYVARHEPDFLFGNDLWFRGMELRYGPDGGVYLTDWSDVGECHETDGDLAHRENGRIYKITYGDVKPVKVDLSKLSDEELAKLQAPQRTRLVCAPGVPTVARACGGGSRHGGGGGASAGRPTFQGTESARRVRLRAFWALHDIGKVRPERFLDDADEVVRRWAVRLAFEDHKPSETTLHALEAQARTDKPSVRLAIASGLQRIPAEMRWNLAGALLGHPDDAKDTYLSLMTWYGVEPLAAVDTARAADLVNNARVPLHRRFLARRIWVEPKGGDVLVALLGRLDNSESRRDVLEGMNEALVGRKRVEPPAGWSALFDKLTASRDAGVRRQATFLALRFGDPRAAVLLTATAKDASAPAGDRREALQALTSHRQPGLAIDLIALLDDPAVRGASLRALAAYDDPATPAALLSQLPVVLPGPTAMTLCSRSPHVPPMRRHYLKPWARARFRRRSCPSPSPARFRPWVTRH